MAKFTRKLSACRTETLVRFSGSVVTCALIAVAFAIKSHSDVVNEPLPESEYSAIRVHAFKTSTWALLGINGEIYSHHERMGGPSPATILLHENGNAFDLYIGDSRARSGRIDSDGNLALNRDTPGLSNSRKLPKVWKVSTARSNSQSILGDRWMLESESGTKSSVLPPDNAKGWAVLLVSGIIYMPTQTLPKPENFVWLVDESKNEDGFFSVVHSGPLHEGVYIRVSRAGASGACLLTFGPGADGLLEVPSGTRYWPMRYTENNEEVIMSEGTAVSASGDASVATRLLFRDGRLDGMVMPPVH